jgi:hypothetical protein
MKPIGSPETSVSNHLTPRNNPEHGRIQFNRGGSLRSRTAKQCSDFPTHSHPTSPEHSRKIQLPLYIIYYSTSGLQASPPPLRREIHLTL